MRTVESEPHIAGLKIEWLTARDRFFTFYRNVAGTIYPVIPDTASFEANLNTLLTNRSLSGGVHVSSSDGVERPFGVSLSWLGLLFAVLASGSQSSNSPAKERELTSQVYSELHLQPVSECQCLLFQFVVPIRLFG